MSSSQLVLSLSRRCFHGQLGPEFALKSMALACRVCACLQCESVIQAPPPPLVCVSVALQGSPLDFDLKKALKGQPINADTLEALGQEVRWVMALLKPWCLNWMALSTSAAVKQHRFNSAIQFKQQAAMAGYLCLPCLPRQQSLY